MEAKEIVSRDPEVMSGELVFSGTRVPVRTLVDYLKADYSVGAFLEEFPTVAREQAEGYIEMARVTADAVAAVTAYDTAEAASRRTGGPAGGRVLEELTPGELRSLSGGQAMTPSGKGSGLSDVGREHDRYLAEDPGGGSGRESDDREPEG